MPSRVAILAPPAAGAISVSLVVKLTPRSTKTDLQRDVRKALGPEWKVARLFEADLAKPELMRWFRVTGTLAVAGLTQTQAAWEASHRLRRSGSYEIEPQIPKTTYAPPEAVIRSGGPQKQHLPGSASKTWGLQSTRVLEAWKLTPRAGGRKRGAGVVIGHPDTGYTRHREIYPSALDLQLDRDFLDGDEDAEDPMLEGTKGHGTSTGSVIASRASHDVTGVAPAATLRPIRAIIDVLVWGGGTVAEAIDHARRTHADVISMSLGGLCLGGVQDAVDAAVVDGCIVLAAAGNVWPTVAEPANYPSCIAVAGINANDKKWVSSASGHQVAISAPGESVWNAVWRNGAQVSDRGHGTSYAVAHVAGVAALWLAFHGPAKLRTRYGSATASVFRRLLATTARTPAGWDSSNMGAGIVDARALLMAELPEPADLPDTKASPGGAVASGREILRLVTTPAAFRRLDQAVQSAGNGRGGPSVRNAKRDPIDNELLYRELVYLATEQPTAIRSLGGRRPRDGRESIQAAATLRSLTSPALAERLSG